ncbi:MAG: PhoH family protein [Christensenellaceae bacterium]
MDRLSKILGAFDENLTLLSRELNLVSYVEGVKIVLEGEEKDVACGEEVISALLRFAEGGESVDRSRIVYCIELAKEGRVGDIAGILSGVVAVTSRGKQIKCKTVGQSSTWRRLKNTVVFGVGPAGTGKSRRMSCRRRLQEQAGGKDYSHPSRGGGRRKAGLSAGRFTTKVDPYLRPLYDALQEMLGAETYAKLMEKGVIEVAPLAYMRGRTLSGAFIILDEAQNTTKEQMKMFLTRMGEGSKTVVTGDVTQVDLPEGKTSGLVHAVDILKDVEGIEICRLTDKDVVRHPWSCGLYALTRRTRKRAEGRRRRKKRRMNIREGGWSGRKRGGEERVALYASSRGGAAHRRRATAGRKVRAFSGTIKQNGAGIYTWYSVSCSSSGSCTSIISSRTSGCWQAAGISRSFSRCWI